VSSRYRVLRTLLVGERGSRQVRLVQDQLRGQVVVLKSAAVGSQAAAALLAEGALHATLAHPALVPVLGRFAHEPPPGDGGTPVAGFVTRWVDGEPFVAALRARPLQVRVAALARLLQGVAYLHRRGVLHLDLKPDNALVVDDAPVLLDLGTARPLDAGPGEAGGTLGYAAPEVIQGQAASVAADLYSAGVMAYELLAGVGPHGVQPTSVPRSDLVASDPVPLRALAPQIPRGLAEIVDSLVQRDPMGRPTSTTSVLDALAAAGFQLPPAPAGQPPLAGRGPLVEALVERVTAGAGLSVVCGASGVGRRRLLQAALGALVDRGVPAIDLLGTGPGARTAGLLAGLAPGVALWDGPLPDEPARQALRSAGWHLVQLAGEEALDPEAFEVSPLDPEGTAELGRWLGVASAPDLLSLYHRTGGHPGRILAALGSAEAPEGQGDAALALLGALPAGVPREVLPALGLVEAVPRLQAGGHVHWDGERLYRVRRVEPSGLPPVAVQALDELVRAAPDPVFAGLVLARAGRFEAAVPHALSAVGGVGDRADLLELVGRLAGAGLQDGLRLRARLALDEHREAQAVEDLEALTERTLADRLLLARAYKGTKRLDQADALLAGVQDREFLLERARVALAGRDLGQALVHVAQAEALGAARPDCVSLRLLVALKHLDAGTASPEAEDRVAEAEGFADAECSPRLLSVAGRVAGRLGQPERAVRLLIRAVARADVLGDRGQAILIRTNLGNLLQDLGRDRQARRVYKQGIELAQEVQAWDRLVKLQYAMANLELRCSRLPAAGRSILRLREVLPRASAGIRKEAHVRADVLDAEIQLGLGELDLAAAALGRLPAELDPRLEWDRVVLLAELRLFQGRPQETLTLLDRDPAGHPRPEPDELRGRAHIAMGRRHLETALQVAPKGLDLSARQVYGRTLLAWAGEDLDPDSFASRRDALDLATKVLRGPSAARAASLRDRLLPGPGAALESIVTLTEAMGDPEGFPRALAQVVKEALGAHRALIMVRPPGQDRQLGYTELSGEEAAGIADEVLQHIRFAHDVWRADDAFADPKLREASATVRTFELKSLLAVAIPYRGTDEAIGALYVDDVHRRNSWGPEEEGALQRLARAVGQVVGLLPELKARGLREAPRETLGVWVLPDRARELEAVAERLRSSEGPQNLLLSGPTGAGKTVLARRLARECLGLEGVEEVALRRGDTGLMVSQLFGAVKGEFTGAVTRVGAVQRAIEGRRALFLDEVQTLDHDQQQTLLPLLDVPQRRFGRLTGSALEVRGTLHVILATNARVDAGRWKEMFRDDLWYRMSRIHVALDPLAERGMAVVDESLKALLGAQGAPGPDQLLEPLALARVLRFEWPGNLRQLAAFAEELALRHKRREPLVRVDDLPKLGLGSQIGLRAQATGAPRWDDQVKVEAVLSALRRHAFVQLRAAEELQMSRSSLNKFLKRHGLLDQVKREKLRTLGG